MNEQVRLNRKGMVKRMSKFTTELRFICEELAGQSESKGYNSIDAIITAAAPLIFSFDYPIFDNAYKLPLEKKIIRHYYTREISEETYGLWKLRLENKMNEIMPYYNQLYSSQLLQFNPLYDTDITRTHNKEIGETTETNNTINQTAQDIGNSVYEADNTNWRLYSDTPQGGIEGIEGTGTPTGSGTVENNTYLTDVTKTTNHYETETNTQHDTTNETVGQETRELANVEEYIEHVTGKNAGMSYSRMLTEFRNTFLNIDVDVINDLSDLFFGLWW